MNSFALLVSLSRARLIAALLCFVFLCGSIVSTTAAPGARQFPIGSLGSIADLPAGPLKSQLHRLPPPSQDQALRWLNSFHFTAQDLPALRADPSGGIFYVCQLATKEPAQSEPPVAAAAVPVSPFPQHLILHSRPGAPNVLILEFSGMTVTNTAWNTEVSRSVIPAVAFSTDSDLTTFSDFEQLAIKRIWQRMAEDYAPFNIDVTTERPSSLTTRTAIALITRTTDANGAANPFNYAGGVAYVNVFGIRDYASYRPAWIYHNNLGNVESYIAEAASHEIGHNLGLSHDGKTDGTEYYSGHGSGEISWGPLMGTGYDRNVSQWSRGEYYLANNTEDDLAVMAGKITYRVDDHANTAGSATALTISGTNIVFTTPENDPANTNTVNKGVLERATDLDVFSFVTGTGPVRLEVKPWITPSGTRGGNLDVLLELYNEASVLLMTNNPATLATAVIQTNLTEGRYYLQVRNSGAGNPTNSTPSGYTPYASLGQYFVSGYITPAQNFIVPPVAELVVTELTQSGQTSKQFTVTYSDNLAINVSTIDSSDIRVTGPGGYDQLAQLLSVNNTGNGTPRTATYSVTAPGGGTWSSAHNGTYTILMRTNQVADIEGALVAAGELGQFQVAVPVALYAASMDTNPGWTLEPEWQYGSPAYSSGGLTAGFSGANIIAYNLSGNYPNNLSVKYATTPAINCSGASALTLRFKRWLRTKVNDPVSIQVSTNGASWLTLWSGSSAIADTSWQEVQYSMPTGIAGSPNVRIRWSIASSVSKNEIGWNIDDVELLASGALDTAPPVPVLNVADVSLAGSPGHSCSVTYTDSSAVRLSSLDSMDLVVTGPNSYSNTVEFVGADLPMDGSPVTATYSIPAPGGTWDVSDNGTYFLLLQDGAVSDTFNNATPAAVPGSFKASIPTNTPGFLAVSPADDLSSTGNAGGPFNPAGITYTLRNSGGSGLVWTSAVTQAWLDLSIKGGTLMAGASTNLTVSINSAAAALPPGNYADTISFLNTTALNGNTVRHVALTITNQELAAIVITNAVHTGADFVFSFETVAQHTYTVEYTDSLPPSGWTVLMTVPGSGGVVTFTNFNVPMGLGFYRVRSP